MLILWAVLSISFYLNNTLINSALVSFFFIFIYNIWCVIALCVWCICVFCVNYPHLWDVSFQFGLEVCSFIYLIFPYIDPVFDPFSCSYFFFILLHRFSSVFICVCKLVCSLVMCICFIFIHFFALSNLSSNLVRSLLLYFCWLFSIDVTYILPLCVCVCVHCSTVADVWVILSCDHFSHFALSLFSVSVYIFVLFGLGYRNVCVCVCSCSKHKIMNDWTYFRCALFFSQSLSSILTTHLSLSNVLFRCLFLFSYSGQTKNPYILFSQMCWMFLTSMESMKLTYSNKNLK